MAMLWPAFVARRPLSQSADPIYGMAQCAIPHGRCSVSKFILSAVVRIPGYSTAASSIASGVDGLKTIRVIRTLHGRVAPYGHAVYLRTPAQDAPITINIASQRLQHALVQVEELERVLAASQQEAIAAQQQVAALTESNARLSELAVRREREVASVRHFAYHDELTGLPNRALLLDRLDQALVRAKRQRKQLALLLLDLDGFKDVNDRLGHIAGDKLLQGVAERLLSCIRASDTACRYGGDEFVVLLPEVDDQKRALVLAGEIRARLAKPYMVDDYPIAVTASVGVAVYPLDGMSQDDLIEQADVAMYLAKPVKSISKNHMT